MQSNTATLKKEKARSKIKNDVEAFLAAGGQIHEVQVHENRWYKEAGKKGQRIRQSPLTITEARLQHRWRRDRINPFTEVNQQRTETKQADG